MNFLPLLLLAFLKNNEPGEGRVSADSEGCRKLLLENLKFIEERCYKAYGLAVKQNLDNVPVANKADSLLVEVVEHLTSGDYRVLREYKGKASLRRYLEAVICNKVIDIYRRKEGRGRAAEKARQFGEAGVRLHELVNMKGLPVEEAHSIMNREAVFTGGIEALREMAEKIGSRVSVSHREVSLDAIAPYGQDPEYGQVFFKVLRDDSGRLAVADEAHGPERAYIEKEEEKRKAVVLVELVQSLSPEERLMVRLKYVDGRSVREISKAIGCTEKRVYKKLDSMLKRCRKMLYRKGFDGEDIL